LVKARTDKEVAESRSADQEQACSNEKELLNKKLSSSLADRERSKRHRAEAEDTAQAAESETDRAHTELAALRKELNDVRNKSDADASTSADKLAKARSRQEATES